jgi:formate C-acetyltransferase
MSSTLTDIYLKTTNLTNRAAQLRKVYFQAMPEVCIERPELVTKYCRNNNLLGKERVSVLEKAKMYRYVLENRRPVVSHDHSYQLAGKGKEMERFRFEDTSVFAGSTTSKFKGVILYPEFLALSIWPELSTISTRMKNPYHLSGKDAKILERKVFPYWMNDTILEIGRARFLKDSVEAYGLKLMQYLVFFLGSKNNCISHTVPDFSRAIRYGLRQMINEAKAKRDAAADPQQEEFFSAIVEVLEGIVGYSRNLADKAEALARDEQNASKRQALMEIADIYRRVPEFSARTFREGLTTVWICWTAIHLENPNIGLSLGRLDQPPLSDLYLKDRENGLTIEEAIELVCFLWLKIGDHVPMIPDAGEQLFGGTGSNQAITIGGIRPVNGKPEDAVTDLSYIILRATELMMLRDPNLNARYYPGVNSKEYLRRLCDANLTTKATPALHNDKAVIEALEGSGDTFEQASDYAVVGCVEPASNGRAYTASASILLNLLSILDLTLYNGRHRHTGLDNPVSIETGAVDEFKTFDDFKKAFRNQLKWMADHTTTLNNRLGEVHQDFYPTPVLSAFFKGPMEKGKDLIQGGAEVNASGVTIIGLADTADSLSAIEHVVFKEKQCTLPKLLKALHDNFKGHEVLYQRLLKAPKYGNEDPLAENNIKWLLETIHQSFSSIDNYRGGKYRVGYWTMTNHAGFGRLIQATPNGRKARQNFSSGITPVSGMAPQLTAALNSAASFPATCITSGMALNLKYTPEMDKESMLDNFTATTAAFFDDLDGSRPGGMEIQFNIADHDTFVDALKHPQNYPELLVRVSGYTAYFKDLNPRMQKEIIDRNEYNLASGSAVQYAAFPLKEETDSSNLDWMRKIPGAALIGDKLLELLLHAMDLTLAFSKSCRKKVKYFNGRYLFESKDGEITSSVIFDDGDMKVRHNGIKNYDVRVIFADEVALMEFLFSENQDILNSLLENKVEVEGNLNYIYRFGYLAKAVRQLLLDR